VRFPTRNVLPSNVSSSSSSFFFSSPLRFASLTTSSPKKSRVLSSVRASAEVRVFAGFPPLFWDYSMFLVYNVVFIGSIDWEFFFFARDLDNEIFLDFSEIFFKKTFLSSDDYFEHLEIYATVHCVQGTNLGSENLICYVKCVLEFVLWWFWRGISFLDWWSLNCMWFCIPMSWIVLKKNFRLQSYSQRWPTKCILI